MAYNSHYLREDEIDYELRIRDFQCKGRLDEKRRTLRHCLANERRTPLFVPYFVVTDRAEIDSEIRICKSKLDELSATLNRDGAPSHQNPVYEHSIFTLLLHLAQRLNRLKPQFAEDLSRVASLNEAVAELKENYYPQSRDENSDEEIAAQSTEATSHVEQTSTTTSPTTSPAKTSQEIASTVSSLMEIGAFPVKTNDYEKLLERRINEQSRQIEELQSKFRELRLQGTGVIPKTSIDRRLTADALPFIPITCLNTSNNKSSTVSRNMNFSQPIHRKKYHCEI